MADKDKKASPEPSRAAPTKPAATDKTSAGAKPAAEAAPATPKKKFTLPKISRKALVIAGVALLVLACGGGTAAFLLSADDEPPATQADAKGSDTKGDDARNDDAKKQPKRRKDTLPVFVELDMFTANLRDDDNDRYIQVKLVAEVKDSPSGETLKSMMPAVRNEVLLLLGSKLAADVATREGKQALANEIVVAANKTLAHTLAAGSVENVNFTHIIVQ